VSTERTRVALIEDHRLLAETLAVSLARRDFKVAVVPVPQVDRPGELLGSILAGRPHVALLDLDLGGAGDGTALVRPLTQSGCAVVVVTASEDLNHWGRCLAHGATTVLPKSVRLEELVDTIRDVRDGRAVLSSERHQRLVEEWQRHETGARGVRLSIDRLSRREREVLKALARGHQVRDIANASHVTEATVRTQVKSILSKFGVRSQIAAVAIAHDAELALDLGPELGPELAEGRHLSAS
jgi:two-component system, NarL family, nitrate/nitrite response regulator NarL